jgi:hypothetical protein
MLRRVAWLKFTDVSEVFAAAITGAGCSKHPEFWVNVYQTTRRNIPEDNHLHILLRDNLESHLVRLIQLCLDKTCSEVRIGKHLCAVPIQNGLKQGGALSAVLLKLALEGKISECGQRTPVVRELHRVCPRSSWGYKKKWCECVNERYRSACMYLGRKLSTALVSSLDL